MARKSNEPSENRHVAGCDRSHSPVTQTQGLLFETRIRGGGLPQFSDGAVHLHRSRKLCRARVSDFVVVEAVNGTNVKRAV